MANAPAVATPLHSDAFSCREHIAWPTHHHRRCGGDLVCWHPSPPVDEGDRGGGDLECDGAIQPPPSVWKRLKASRMEAIWSSLSALAPIAAGG
jgi:hypothetical protein